MLKNKIKMYNNISHIINVNSFSIFLILISIGIIFKFILFTGFKSINLNTKVQILTIFKILLFIYYRLFIHSIYIEYMYLYISIFINMLSSYIILDVPLLYSIFKGTSINQSSVINDHIHPKSPSIIVSPIDSDQMEVSSNSSSHLNTNNLAQGISSNTHLVVATGLNFISQAVNPNLFSPIAHNELIDMRSRSQSPSTEERFIKFKDLVDASSLNHKQHSWIKASNIDIYKINSYGSIRGVYYEKEALITKFLEHDKCKINDLMGSPLFMKKSELINLLALDGSFKGYSENHNIWDKDNFILGIRILHKFDRHFNISNEILELYRTTLLVEILDSSSPLSQKFEKLGLSSEEQLRNRILRGITKSPDSYSEFTGDEEQSISSKSSYSSLSNENSISGASTPVSSNSSLEDEIL